MSLKFKILPMPGLTSLRIDADPRFRWDPDARRYRWIQSGKFISQSRFETLTQESINRMADQVDGAVTDLVEKRLDTPAFQRVMADQLSKLHLQQYLLGVKSMGNMADGDVATVNANLRSQLEYLVKFGHDIETKDLSPDQIRRRAQRYVKHTKLSQWSGVRSLKKKQGKREERRVLHPEADHCQSCIDYAAMGWVPIGTHPVIGQRCECLDGCKCKFQFR